MSKYNNRKTVVDGITFDSKAEAQRYNERCLLVRAGEISDLHLQPRYELQGSFVDCHGRRQRPITYVADFAYLDKDGQLIVEDVKGKKTEAYRIKAKLFMAKYTSIRFVEVS